MLVLLLVVSLAVFGLWFLKAVCFRDQAEKYGTADKLRRLGTALLYAGDEHDRNLPPSSGTYEGKDGTLFFHILPFLQAEDVWKQNRTEAFIDSFSSLADRSFPEGRPWTSYASNSAVFGVRPEALARVPQLFGEKGSSNTITLMTRYAVASGNIHAWADTSQDATYLDGPNTQIEFNVTYEKAANDTAHAMPAGVNCYVSLADGSSTIVSNRVSPATFRWACDPRGKGPPPSDWDR
jgi:hypothetical protein